MCYVNIGVQCLWKAIPEYKVTMTSFTDFKKAVLKYYSKASGDFIYTLHDMDVLVGECQHLKFSSAIKLNTFHLQFTTITDWLIEKQLIGVTEQQHAYI